MHRIKFDLDFTKPAIEISDESDEENPSVEHQPRKKLKRDSDSLQKDEETSDEEGPELGHPRYIIKLPMKDSNRDSVAVSEQREIRTKEQVSGQAKAQDTSTSSEIDIEEEKDFDELFSRALKIYCNELFEICQENIQEAQSSIVKKFKDRDFQSIDFDSSDHLIAYFSRYSTLNACVARNRFLTAFKNCNELREIINKNNLNVVSLGGGPGTDMIGFLSAMRPFMKNPRTRLNLTVVDSWRRWESFYNIIQFLIRDNQFGNASDIYQNYNVTSCFLQADLKNSRVSRKYHMDLQSANVVLLVRVLNILEYHEEELVLNIITSIMKKGALLLIVDTRDKYKEILELEVLYEFDLSQKCYDLAFSPRKKFDIYPATTAKCNIVICRKK